jgi:DNA-binding transcriptional ArsR family regulator
MADPLGENQGLLAALKHPLRRRILRVMADRKPISPRELAGALEEPLSTVSYHVRVLAENGVVKEVRRQQVRGATQHFYRWALKAKWAKTVLRATEGDAPKPKPKPKPKKKPKGKQAKKRPKDG